MQLRAANLGPVQARWGPVECENSSESPGHEYWLRVARPETTGARSTTW